MESKTDQLFITYENIIEYSTSIKMERKAPVGNKRNNNLLKTY